MLISGFNAYLRVYWILRKGATSGGYKNLGVRNPTLMMQRLNSWQIQDAIRTVNWKPVGGCSSWGGDWGGDRDRSWESKLRMGALPRGSTGS